MRRTTFLLLFLAALPAWLQAQNALPVIVSFNVIANPTTKICTVGYTVLDPDNDSLEVVFEISNDGGKTYSVQPTNVQGDVGFPVSPGASKSITCDLSNLSQGGDFLARLVVDDREPVDIAALVAAVDSQRLLQNLRFVEGIRHRTAGAVHLAATRDSMGQVFENLGLHRSEHSFAYGTYTARNVIGQQAGVGDAQKTVIIDAHYDSVNNAPGADDNGSGTVGVWESARVLSRFPSRKTLRYIGFDLEEAGLVGSKKYVETQIPAPEVISGVFNFEMIGYYSDKPNTQELPTGFEILFPVAAAELQANDFRGDFITNVANTPSQSMALLFNNAAQQYVPDLKVITLVIPGNGSIAPDLTRSDHAFFWSNNKPALMLTDGAEFRNECYHTPGDTLNEKLNFTFMANVVKATVAAAAELAELRHGDWDTRSFQLPVGTSSPVALCDLSARYERGSLSLSVGECALNTITFSLFDERGALVTRGLFDVSLNHAQAFPLSLPTGTYLCHFTHPSGNWVEKIVVAR
jgi:hypothetical protein